MVATRKVEPDYNVVPVGGETTLTAVLAPAGLSGCGMLLAKLAQGLLAALITFFLAPLLPETVTASAGTL